MRLEAFGHAAIGLSWTGADGRPCALLIDPYEPGGFGGRIGYGPIDLDPDLILVTHDHLDHNHTAPFPDAPVVGPRTLRALPSGEASQAPDLLPGGLARSLELRALEVDHDSFGGRTRGGQSWMLRVVVDGLVVVHSGDVGELPEQHRLDALRGDRGVDVLCVVCGGFYTVGGAEAAELARRLGARIVVPMHYATARCTLPGMIGAEPLLARLGRVWREPGRAIELTATRVEELRGSVVALAL